MNIHIVVWLRFSCTKKNKVNQKKRAIKQNLFSRKILDLKF